MSNRLIVKSQKQYVRLWFEFLKLCLGNSKYFDDLEASRSFYAPWGDVTDVKFDDWWKTHQHLFSVVKVEEIRRISNSPSTINVAIPLNQTLSQTLSQLKKLIEKKQDERLNELGLDSEGAKTKKVGLGAFELTPGVEIRGRSLHEDLAMYRAWQDLGSPSINMETIRGVRDSLLARPKAQWVPIIIADDNPLDISNTVRQFRRRLKRVEKVCEAVSKGQFPGKSSIK